jgi:uncharacterized protein YjeT (DUF2065 family)
MAHELGLALALLLVFEGIFPFLSPAGLRRMLTAVQELSDTQLRGAGLGSMLLGLLLLYILRY